MKEVIESMGTAMSISGLVQLSINEKEFILSLAQAKILCEDLAFSIRQIENLYGELKLPEIITEAQAKMVIEKTKCQSGLQRER